MRAVFCILVLLNLCFLGILSSNKNFNINKADRYSKTRLLAAQQNYNNLLTASAPPPILTRLPSSTISPVSVNVAPSAPGKNSSSAYIKKRRKYLKKELNKLRKSLKNKRIRNDRGARNVIVRRLNEINAELRKYAKKGVKRRRRKHRSKRVKGDTGGERSNILEVTTARNKNYVFKWSLKDNSSLNRIIRKLNQNPEHDFDADTSSEFKAQSDGVAPIFGDYDRFVKDKLGESNVMDLENDVNLLPDSAAPKNYADNSLTTELDEVLKITPDAATSTTTENLKADLDKNKISTLGGLGSTNAIAKINYAGLMKTHTTTLPPLTNVTLNMIVEEFNAISNQIGVILPGAQKYPKYNFTRSAVYRRRKTRCSIRKGGCEHICYPKGPKKCSCFSGFALASNKRNCVDTDECAHNNGGCKQICHNTPGSYYCGCPSGLRLSDDRKSCEDVNECLLRNGHGPCQDTCANTYGSYKCSCLGLNGTRLGKDEHSCEDVDECLEGRSGCSHGCVNTLGRAFCTCPDGMDLGEDWNTCADIDECKDEETQKRCQYGCMNTIGSYYCGENYELQSDQTASPVPDHVACPPLFPPKHGFLECSRDKGLSVKLRTKSGRLRVTNRPGTFCRLVCPLGYKHVGKFKVTCGLDGRWIGSNSGKCTHFPPPRIKCPDSQVLYVNEKEDAAPVRFQPPKTNLDWEHVTSDPMWAKDLTRNLPPGYHWLTFKVTDPRTQLSAKCSFYIIIKISRQ